MIEPAAARLSSRTWQTAAMPLVSFIVLGLPAGAIGIAWPPMRASFGAPLAGLGLILAAVTVGYFAGNALSGPVAVRVGGTSLWVGGCLFGGVGLLGMAAAPAWWLLPLLGLVVGAGSGLIDASVNAQVSLTRGIRYMGWLHASWAIGAAIAPQVVVVSLTATGSWRPALGLIGGAFLATGAVVAVQHQAKTHQADPHANVGASEPIPANYRSAIILIAGLLFLGAGLEASTGDWSYTQLTLGRGLAAVTAGLASSLFWLGLAGGRIGLGLAGHRFTAMRLLDLSIVAALLAALLFWLAPAIVSALVALPLLGIAVSLLFPLLLSAIPGRVGTSMTGHAVGYGLAGGTLGGGGLPALIGLVLQGLGLWALGPCLSVIAAALAALHLLARRAGDR